MMGSTLYLRFARSLMVFDDGADAFLRSNVLKPASVEPTEVRVRGEVVFVDRYVQHLSCVAHRHLAPGEPTRKIPDGLRGWLFAAICANQPKRAFANRAVERWPAEQASIVVCVTPCVRAGGPGRSEPIEDLCIVKSAFFLRCEVLRQRAAEEVVGDRDSTTTSRRSADAEFVHEGRPPGRSQLCCQRT